MAVYGGFDGTETVSSGRDSENNLTYLSGDIDTSGNSDSYHVVLAESSVTTTGVLDGFIVRKGRADSSTDDADKKGAGLYIEGAPTISNCWVKEGTASKFGGAAYFTGSSSTHAVIDDVKFSHSTASEHGAGVYITGAAPSFTGCAFHDNTATQHGGGLYLAGDVGDGYPVISECNFADNTASDDGGAIYVGSSGRPLVELCNFSSNDADNGGAVYLGSSADPSVFWANGFYGNVAAVNGGGIYNNSVSSSAEMVSCLFSGNRADNGGGVYNNTAHVNFINCTFSANDADDGFSGGYGGGMYNYDSSADIDNFVFWNNVQNASGTTTDAQIYEVIVTTQSPIVDYSDVKGGWSGAGGTGNIDSNPLFIDHNGTDNIVGTTDDDLRLTNGPSTRSPCLDVGSDGQLPGGDPGAYDLDLNARDVDSDCDATSTVDMGAYEAAQVCS